MPVEIQLTGGLVALVDASDEALVMRYSWHMLRRGNTCYAKHTMPWTDGKRPVLLMHRLLAGVTGADTRVDHRDGNGLNNCRANLRVCCHQQNLANARRRADNRSGFKGVGYNRRIDRYHARIHIDGRSKFLGSFRTPQEAHQAYCRAAAEQFGEFARFG